MTENEDVADFYLGRGPEALYLGTAANASPAQLEAWRHFTTADPVRQRYTSADFRRAVSIVLNAPGSQYGRTPWRTWPHAYEDSTQTAWSYSFYMGSVHVDHFGFPQAVIYCNQARKQAAYPSMCTVPS